MGAGGGIARQYQHRSMINTVEFLLEHAWPQLSISQPTTHPTPTASTTTRKRCHGGHRRSIPRQRSRGGLPVWRMRMAYSTMPTATASRSPLITLPS
jgi:hypothetical protein